MIMTKWHRQGAGYIGKIKTENESNYETKQSVWNSIKYIKHCALEQKDEETLKQVIEAENWLKKHGIKPFKNQD